MKTVRFVFAFAVLSLFALPSFATICGYCDGETNECVPERELQIACKEGTCEELFSPTCERSPKAGPELLAADYSLASVEIATPARHVTPAKAHVSVEKQPLEVTK